MKISDAVQSELVFLDLDAEDGETALGVVARRLGQTSGLGEDLVFAALMERERLGSTSVGNGFAIPHCKLANLDAIVVALARFSDEVDFGSDSKPERVRFFFVVLSPPDQPTEHLQVLSQIARVLKSGELRNELIQAPDASAVISSIQRAAESEGL